MLQERLARAPRAARLTVRLAPSTPIKAGDNVGLSVSGRHNNWFDSKSTKRVEV